MKLTFQRNTCHNIVCELKLIFTEPENYFLLCLTEKNKFDLILARCQQIDFFVTYRLEFQNFPRFFNFYSKHQNVYQTYTLKILAESHRDHCQGQLAHASGLKWVQIKCILRKSD